MGAVVAFHDHVLPILAWTGAGVAVASAAVVAFIWWTS